MDFFEQQDNARRNTRLLVLVFALAVLSLTLLTNAAVAAFLFFSAKYNVYTGSPRGWQDFLANFTWARFGGIGLAVTATVALVVLVRWIQLSSGGKAVAESLGGRPILHPSADPTERRCLNVVEELALAANMPVPAVYVLDGERGINAFAAGIVPADAVVAVTRGTIDQLQRHELQGVIGHEFSHILNGDMRLNIRLAAMLKGITFVGDVGYLLLRSQGRSRASGESRGGAAALPVLGLALCAVGWLGGLAAGYIKAAISRQREFLADASAVQFTRDVRGIADALKVIGGYLPGTLVHAARAAEMSHIFFGQAIHSLWQTFATHPPLDERIRRLEPNWDGRYIERKPVHRPNLGFEPQAAAAGRDRAAIVAAAVAAADATEPAAAPEPAGEDAQFAAQPPDDEAQSAARSGIPLALIRHSHDPLGAQALICAALLSPEREIYQRQMDALTESETRGLTELAHTLYPAVAALDASLSLPLINRCLPALMAISEPQYHRLKRTLLRLIQADAHIALHEWCLYQLVRHYLDPEFVQVRASRPRYRRLRQVSGQVQVVLSVLAHEGGGDAQQAFQAGVRSLELERLQLLPREDCGVAAFSKAVHTLADLYPLRKPRLLKAMGLAAAADDSVAPGQREVIAAMAAVMDCPGPGLVGEQAIKYSQSG